MSRLTVQQTDGEKDSAAITESIEPEELPLIQSEVDLINCLD
jgi:hypothetical protein